MGDVVVPWYVETNNEECETGTSLLQRSTRALANGQAD